MKKELKKPAQYFLWFFVPFVLVLALTLWGSKYLAKTFIENGGANSLFQSEQNNENY